MVARSRAVGVTAAGASVLVSVAVAAVLALFLTGCSAASSSASQPNVPTGTVSGDPYGTRVGEVTPGSLPGTVTVEVFSPSYDDSGAWFRVSDVTANGTTRTLCEITHTYDAEWSSTGSRSCEARMLMQGDERKGVLLTLRDVPATSFYEVETRGLGMGDALLPEPRAVVSLGHFDEVSG